MHAERFQKLMEFYKQDPHDAFVIYGLALELRADKPIEAAQFFDKLLSEHPDYVPTYYHAAEHFAELAEIEKAKMIFEKGIELCTSKNEAHALKELKNAYLNFQFEHDL